jgi:hypothetical protein
MGRCANCRKKTHLGMICKWCACEHCASCVQIEIHKCAGVEDMIHHNQTLLAQKLTNEKTVAHKVFKI